LRPPPKNGKLGAKKGKGNAKSWKVESLQETEKGYNHAETKRPPLKKLGATDAKHKVKDWQKFSFPKKCNHANSDKLSNNIGKFIAKKSKGNLNSQPNFFTAISIKGIIYLILLNIFQQMVGIRNNLLQAIQIILTYKRSWSLLPF